MRCLILYIFVAFYKNNLENKIIEPHNSMRIAFFTLGCKLNFAETSMISRKFQEKGFNKVNFNSEADIYVINTCSVTQVADKKCRQIIKKATRKGSKVVVIGCYSQLKPDEIAGIEGVDLVLGTNEKFKVVGHVENLLNGTSEKIISGDINKVQCFDSSFSIFDRTRAFLKIQDGCDYGCSYCTIPFARGKSRNDCITNIINQAEVIAAKGINEVVLTGVNIGDFGHSTNENFFMLIQELNKNKGIERYRISSIEPNLLSDEIIEFIHHSVKFVPHFHIPLQSGSNKILTAMGRRYNRELFSSRILKIKSLMPYSCIGADIIAGFPGESDDDFNDSYSFIESLDLSYLHVFPYSERPGTRAVNFPGKVGPSVKERRCRILSELSDLKRNNFYQKNFGRNEKVIFESGLINGLMTGYTSNYIKVEAPYKKEMIGKMLEVTLLNLSNKGNYTTNNYV